MKNDTTQTVSAAADERSGWDGRDAIAILVIVAAALLLRLLHLQQIQAHDPFFFIPSVDGRLYDAWAQRMLEGDGLGDRVPILGPLYPAFVALVYGAAGGPSMLALKLVQALLGAITCGLVYALARELFDRRVAMVAAGGAVLYGMLVFYGGTVMIVNVQIPLVMTILIAIVRTLRRPRGASWLGVGLLVGLSVLARQTLLMYVPLILGWMWYAMRDAVPRAERALMCAIFCAGVAIPILPVTVHNVRVGDDFVLLNSTGGANLYMGNNPRAKGIWHPPQIASVRADNPEAMREAFTSVAEREAGRPLKPSEVSSYWSGRALDYVASEPADWLRLELRKLLFFFNAREVWNNRSYTVSRDFSWVLGLPLLGFGLVAPLAIAGLLLSARRWRELAPIYLMLTVYLGTALLFFVLSRYRMPIAPVLLIFAAYAVVCAYDELKQGRAQRLVVPVGAAIVALGVAHLDLGSENLYMAYYNLGNKHRQLQHWDRAVESYRKSLAINPTFISSHNNLALAYEDGQQRDEAAATWRMVLDLAVRRGDARRAARARRHLEELGAGP